MSGPKKNLIRARTAWGGGFLIWVVLSLLISCRAISQRARTLPHEWNQTNGPVVPHDRFPADCKLCHEPGSWHKLREDFQFDHAAETGVPLFGAHLDAQCLRCHNDRGPVAAYANRGCVGCHVDSHRGQLGTNCQDCHNMNDWTPREQIDRHNRTQFPLIGVHAGVACRRCHQGADVGNFLRAPTACADCHQQDLARAVTPNHANLGWVSNCDRCHLPTDWRLASFTHTRFPLTGAHAATACESCHKNNVYQGLSHDCYACHANDYSATTKPNHAGAGFSTDCKQCHSTIDWSSSSFAHDKFPLTGAHSTVACSLCHQNNVYTGLSHDCSACHLDDYQQTSNPNHAASGFPTACANCHNTTSWEGATFVHTFNIKSGPHSQYNCAECHRVPTNYMIVSCTHCHKHQQLEMDDKHKDENGYSWSSPACISCHPTGK